MPSYNLFLVLKTKKYWKVKPTEPSVLNPEIPWGSLAEGNPLFLRPGQGLVFFSLLTDLFLGVLRQKQKAGRTMNQKVK